MDIESYLLEIIIDNYEQYCSVVLEMSQDEIDALFFNDEGKEMSDAEFFEEHSKDLIIDELIDATYAFLVECGETKEIDLDKIISFLSGKYFIYNYGNDTVVSFLKNTDNSDVAYLFKTNVDFGMALVRSYYLSRLDFDRCLDNRKAIHDNGENNILNKFAKNGYYQIIDSVTTLNDLLRNILCKLYDFYISKGCSENDALKNVWDYFFRDLDPLGELDKMGVDYSSKVAYKRYLMGLMMADLYEDMLNDTKNKAKDSIDYAAYTSSLLTFRMRAIAMPGDEVVRLRVMKLFISLQKDKDKMHENRKKTYEEDRVQELKFYNPLYKLDEMQFKI